VISGPSSLPQPAGVQFINVTSAAEMHNEVMQQINNADIFIAAAAVADYRPVEYADNKIKKSSEELEIKLVKNPDILADVASKSNPPFCVGFAAETQDLEENAKSKLAEKKLDMIVANYVGKTNSGNDLGFNSSRNAVTVITHSTSINFPEDTKKQLAKNIINLIAENYENHQ